MSQEVSKKFQKLHSHIFNLRRHTHTKNYILSIWFYNFCFCIGSEALHCSFQNMKMQDL